MQADRKRQRQVPEITHNANRKMQQRILIDKTLAHFALFCVFTQMVSKFRIGLFANLSMSQTSNKYFIIALDGGGVRCALQIVLLKRIFNRFPQLERYVRLVAGTSAGALVGAALGAVGCKKMAEHMLSEQFAKKIFSESWRHEMRSMRGLYRASYTNKDLRALLCTVFGPETPLNHFHSRDNMPHLLITSFCIDTTEPSEQTAQSVAKVNATNSERETRGLQSNSVQCIEMQDMSASSLSSTSKSVLDRDSSTCDPQIDASPVAAPGRLESTFMMLSGYVASFSVRKWSWRSATLPDSESELLQQPEMSSESVEKRAANPVSLPPSRQAIIEGACQEKRQHEKTEHKCEGKPWHAEIYSTFNESGQKRFVDVLLRTTAAPTYFPAHNGCIDGGIVAQNPSVLAISHALKYGKAEKQDQPIALEDIVLLSIGTGTHSLNMNAYGKNANLGLAQWIPNLMSVFNAGSLDATEINCRNLLPANQFLRLQVKLPREIDLANYTEWDQLVAWAEEENLEPVYAQLQTLFSL